MPNLIVILFNHVYLVFYVGFHCMGCVWERVWRPKTLLKTKWILWEPFLRSEPCAEHMTGMGRVMIVGFSEYFADKAFPRDTSETFYFAILAYLLHHVFTHTIYTLITHIMKGVLFREKNLEIPLRLFYFYFYFGHLITNN